MEPTNIDRPKCANCFKELDELPGLLLEQRSPCPYCGSINRFQSMNMGGSVSFHSSLKAKARHKGQRRPFLMMFTGADYFHRLKKWVQKYRLIDRDNDIYQERVIDPDSNELLHETNEKLTEHKGHGSAKKR